MGTMLQLMSDLTVMGKYSSPYELTVDGAIELNDEIDFEDDIYYISRATSLTEADPTGEYQVPMIGTDSAMWMSSYLMERMSLTTIGGHVIDSSWYENDGLVNTISQIAPFDDEYVQISESPDEIKHGRWNVLPTDIMAHTSVVGGLFKISDIRETFYELCDLINRI